MSSVAPVPEVFQRLFLATDLASFYLHSVDGVGPAPSGPGIEGSLGCQGSRCIWSFLHGKPDEQSSWTVLEAQTRRKRFHPTGFQTLEPSTGAQPHGSFDLFEFRSSQWDYLGDATIRTRRNEDETLHYRGCCPILGHFWQGGCKSPIRVITVEFLGGYGARTVWSPSRPQSSLLPYGGSGEHISQSQTPWYHGLHAPYSTPLLPLWGAGCRYCPVNHGVSLLRILSSQSLWPAPRFGLANDDWIRGLFG
jgi:hypothetical protein